MSPTWKPTFSQDEEIGIYEATYKIPMFLSRSFAVTLKNGNFLVYSPGDDCLPGFEQDLLPKGQVEIIAAPNSLHHMGLASWRERFPEAVVAATPRAIPRLEKLGHQGFTPIDSLADRLPDHLQLLTPPAIKAGEFWLRIETPSGIVWLICDAFFNLAKVPPGLMWKILAKIFDNAPGLKVSKVLKWLFLEDAATYRDWVLRQLEADRPVGLLLCHGKNFHGENLAVLMKKALRERFGAPADT